MGGRSGRRRLIDIQVIGPEQWRLWRHLRLASLRDSPQAFGSRLSDWEEASEERWRARLEYGGGFNLAALVEGEPVGMVAGIPQQDGSAELISMWVDPYRRGGGVAQRLVERLLDWARQTGRQRVWLRVSQSNQRAVGFYQRLGFVAGDRDTEGDLHMQIILEIFKPG